MANSKATGYVGPGVQKTTWNLDTATASVIQGEAEQLGNVDALSFEIAGVFGTATVNIQGSNGGSYHTLTAIAGAGLCTLNDRPESIQPRVTGATGSTALLVRMIARQRGV